jgi:hypothetical protein
MARSGNCRYSGDISHMIKAIRYGTLNSHKISSSFQSDASHGGETCISSISCALSRQRFTPLRGNPWKVIERTRVHFPWAGVRMTGAHLSSPLRKVPEVQREVQAFVLEWAALLHPSSAGGVHAAGQRCWQSFYLLGFCRPL